MSKYYIITRKSGKVSQLKVPLSWEEVRFAFLSELNQSIREADGDCSKIGVNFECVDINEDVML